MILELWGMQSTPSLSLLPGPLWPGVVAPDRVLSIGHHHHVDAASADLPDPPFHPSLSSITPGRSSRLYPVSALSCCMEVLAGRPSFARPCEAFHRSMTLMSSSLLLQQCTACLVRLTRIVFRNGL